MAVSTWVCSGSFINVRSVKKWHVFAKNAFLVQKWPKINEVHKTKMLPKLTAPGIPRRSPIQVLTGLVVA